MMRSMMTIAAGVSVILWCACGEQAERTAPQVEGTVKASDGAPLVRVAGGVFRMGSAEGGFDERPPHDVRLTAFSIDQHEVTNERFEQFVSESTRRPDGPWQRGFDRGQEQFPVRFVSWTDAEAYCAWAGKRLPTEAEWEYAARGADQRRYPWGNEYEPGAARADQAASAGSVAVGSHPEGKSPFGVDDLAGNVWEWTADWYDRWAYASRNGVTDSPTGPSDGAPPEPRFVEAETASGNERSTLKVIRGGGWTGRGADMVRTSKRMFGRPDAWYNDTGFRCVAAADE
jgi:formylglycine-generating enzyme required for sulfatase activity